MGKHSEQECNQNASESIDEAMKREALVWAEFLYDMYQEEKRKATNSGTAA